MANQESLVVAADRLLRRAAESVFGPMYEWRISRWLIRRRGGDPADYSGFGKIERSVFRRPIRTYDDAIDEGEAWGDYYSGDAPKPHIAPELRSVDDD